MTQKQHTSKRLPCGRSRCLLEYLPERLVIEGYRHWMAGYETGSIEPWELAWNLFARELGPRNGREILSAVSSWARECHHHAAEPPRTFPFESQRVCRHECLALASVAAMQHEDERTTEFCLVRLVQAAGIAQTRRATSDLAETLTAHRHALMPIPLPIIASIALETTTTHIH